MYVSKTNTTTASQCKAVDKCCVFRQEQLQHLPYWQSTARHAFDRAALPTDNRKRKYLAGAAYFPWLLECCLGVACVTQAPPRKAPFQGASSDPTLLSDPSGTKRQPCSLNYWAYINWPQAPTIIQSWNTQRQRDHTRGFHRTHT